jgi:hypothetical protein
VLKVEWEGKVSRGKRPMKIYINLAILMNQSTGALGPNMGRLLSSSQWCPKAVSLGHKQIFSSQEILLINQNVQIAGLPECHIAIYRCGEDRPFIRYGRNLVHLEELQKLKEFIGQQKVPPNIAQKLNPELIHECLGHSLRADSA